MGTTTKNYVVYVKETITKKYFINAKDKQEAKDKYLVEGLTSALYDKQMDRQIVYVDLASKDNE
jgi:hypothetical protein